MEKLKAFFNEKLKEAGCDEAGRGCLAGPVVAAAVILPPRFKHQWLNDSKQVSEKRRAELRKIIESEAVSWSVKFVDHQQIDRMNILNASIAAMQQAALDLTVRPDFLLIDGNRFHSFEIPHQCFVKGDARFLPIAAASILAKTHRDEYMENIHHEFPVYNWHQNKGYPTSEHRKAVIRHGFSTYHRKSFQIKELHQMRIEF